MLCHPRRLALLMALTPVCLPACSSSDARLAPGPDSSTPDVVDSSTDSGSDADTGPDATPIDDAPADADAALSSCVLEESSTLPHVAIRFADAGCTFTLAQAQAGITIAYDLVVDEDVTGFVPSTPYFYSSDEANLVLNEVLSGNSQHYCLCDKGLPYPACPEADGGRYPPDGGPAGACDPVTIPAGTYHRTFAWDGRNWNGPSDTPSPEGPLFPAGDYELKVSSAPGSIGDAGSLQAIGRLGVRLTP